MDVELARLAERFLPSYLLPDARSKLLEQINTFPHHRGYYTTLPKAEPLQGDTWTNFIVRNFDTGERKSVSGIIVSNSCDVAPENRALVGQRIIFAPIVSVEKFKNLLRASGRNDQQIESTMGRLEKQHDWKAFYLPPFGEIPESIVLLDDVHSEPLEYFWAAEKQRLLRLSDFGFWLFLLKLSIHLTRLHEEVQRGADD